MTDLADVTDLTNTRKPVVVGVDGTAEGRHALQLGIELAVAYDAPLRLVHVRHENVVVSPMTPLFPELALQQIAERVLHEALGDAQRMGWRGDQPETVLARPPRVAALVDHARDGCLLVLGTRASRPEHLLTGSTTNGVAAACDVPVVCVPAEGTRAAPVHQVGVGVESTVLSLPVLAQAAVLADRLGATVLVMHAFRPSGQYDAAIGARAFAAEWESRTRPFVEDLVEQVRSAHPDVKVEIELRYERPVVALHELSRESDLLVVGRRGHEARLGPTLGSTARTLIRTGRCPVVVVPVAVS
jgi:nucleotide-binding universal stress UspA family protein